MIIPYVNALARSLGYVWIRWRRRGRKPAQIGFGRIMHHFLGRELRKGERP